MVVFSTFWTAATIFEASLAWIVMPRVGWRWPVALSSIPSFAVLIFYIIAPESPGYLCMKGRTIDAHRILEKIARINHAKLPPGMLVSDKTTRQNEEPASSLDAHSLSAKRTFTKRIKSGFSSFFMLFSSKLIRTTLLLWVLFFATAFSYYVSLGLHFHSATDIASVSYLNNRVIIWCANVCHRNHHSCHHLCP